MNIIHKSRLESQMTLIKKRDFSMNMNRHHLVVALMSVGALGVTACTTPQVVKTEPMTTSPVMVKSHNTDKAHSDWSYSGSNGPEFWGDIQDASACKMGQEQSPINITAVTPSTTAAPIINYSQSANLKVNDDDHTIAYTPTTQNNTITLNNERYVLKQLHYHVPSEHQLGGKNYPGEMHFVHANSTGNIAIVGVMLQNGEANDVLRILLNGTQLTVENEVEFTANKVDLSALIPTMPTFYHYSGSLTTPPCSEKVQWYIVKQPLALASDQLAIMTDLYEGNNRPVQSQGRRLVQQLSN